MNDEGMETRIWETRIPWPSLRGKEHRLYFVTWVWGTHRLTLHVKSYLAVRRNQAKESVGPEPQTKANTVHRMGGVTPGSLP